MYVVKPIHKTVKNVQSGIDITVPKVLEIEAPLGGLSIEYEVLIVTNLPIFKSQIHKEDEVVQFTVQKAYKEMEIFHEKISKKLPDPDLPSVPKGRASLTHSSERKRQCLDAFMSYIASNKDISHSPLFHQFIGITRLKKTPTATTNDKSAAQTTPDTEKPTSVAEVTVSDSSESLTCDSKNVVSDDIPDLFQKMKVRKPSNSDPIGDFTDASPEREVPLVKKESLPENDLDLFEEAKKMKEMEKKDVQLFEPKGNTNDADEDADLFRINSPTPPKQNKKGSFPEKVESASVVGKPTKLFEEPVSFHEEKSGDDSKKMGLIDDEMDGASERRQDQSKEEGSAMSKPKELGLFEEPVLFEEEKGVNILKKMVWGERKMNEDPFQEKKFGNVHLFQEQDLQFGGITKDDERLFYIPKEEIKKSKINPFLSPSSESTDEDDVDESIEELTSLAVTSTAYVPPPVVPRQVEAAPKRAGRESAERPTVLPKPSRDELPQKPQVAPRKPAVPSKPTLPPKPKIANKPKTIPKTETGSSQNDVLVNEKLGSSSDVQNLNSMDIMQYIEQEQKASSANANLFD